MKKAVFFCLQEIDPLRNHLEKGNEEFLVLQLLFFPLPRSTVNGLSFLQRESRRAEVCVFIYINIKLSKMSHFRSRYKVNSHHHSYFHQ